MGRRPHRFRAVRSARLAAALLVALLVIPAEPAAALVIARAGLKGMLTLDERKSSDDRFTLQGDLAPAVNAMPDPSAVPVTIAIGTFRQTIPPGAFLTHRTRKRTTWKFKGAKGGLTSATITHDAVRWSFKCKAAATTLAGTTNPVAIELTIGGDSGALPVFFAFTDNHKKAVFKYPAAKTVDADGDGVSVKAGDCNDQEPTVHPGAPERCDGLDNDCNGQVDEGFALGVPSTAGLGPCQRNGVTICAPDGIGTTCGGPPGIPGVELCGNGIDDDCDGEVDEGFNVGTPCSVGTGSCERGGFRVCALDRTGTVCDAVPADGCAPGPAIAIASPANLSSFNQTFVAVSGTVAASAVEVRCDGYLATLANGGFTRNLTLQEGTNAITCVAADADGDAATAITSVTVDTAPPRITIASPDEDTTVATSPLVVTGLVNDIVVGTVNQQQAQVTCNGVTADVVNRTFVANVPLVAGANTITCIATDKAGNVDSQHVHVTLSPTAGPTLRLLSGGGQSGTIGSLLPAPLVAALTDGAGAPVAGKAVVFRVLRNDGVLQAESRHGRVLAVQTDGAGHAQVNYTLGTWAGAGNNQVRATAPGFAGEALFDASAAPGDAALIVADSGDAQEGAVEQRLPKPFVAIVVDHGSNRLGGVPVTFSVVTGGGTLGGQRQRIVSTDGDGRAEAVLTLGPDEGIGNNEVTATFTGNPGGPATFIAAAKIPDDPAETAITGIVLDNTTQPVPGVTLGIEDPTSLTVPKALLLSTTSDEAGHFVLQPVPVGHVKLVADGATTSRPGVWPKLEYELVTIAGRDNTIGMPVYLLPIDVAHGLAVDETHGGTIMLPDVPGFSLTIAPGSVTFLDGTQRGTVSVTMVHPDKVPMVPNFGQQPKFIVTIQPAGVHFNPPAAITIPNAEGLPPGEKTELYSFDHDLGQFVSIGPGTVSEDATVIGSDPGVGVIKGGWHSAGKPVPTDTIVVCDDDNECTDDVFALGEDPNAGGCQNIPLADGTSCSVDVGSLQIDCKDTTVNVEIDDSCQNPAGPPHCMSGRCVVGFDPAAIADGAVRAFDKICHPGCIGDALRTKMKTCLAIEGVRISCDVTPPSGTCGLTKIAFPCALPGVCANTLTLFGSRQRAECGDVGSVILHELVHAAGCDHGAPGHNHNEGTYSPTDKEFGCQESCFGSSFGRGNAAACQ